MAGGNLLGVKRQALDGWIAEALADADKDGPCRQLTLVHMSGTSAQREIHTVRMKENDPRTPKQLAQMFDGKAQGYAQDLPGVQTFNLMAFYGENTEPEAFHPVMVAQIVDMAGLGTESPNSEGLTQQMMRHVEQRERLTNAMTTTLFQASQNSLEALIKQNHMLMEENQEAFHMVKQILLERQLDAHDLKMKEMSFERSTADRQALMKMAPMLVNTLTGKEVFPQAAADTALIDAIADKMTPEALEKLAMANILPNEVMGPLAARFLSFKERKVQEEEKMKLLAAQARVNSQNPEAEAAGDVETVQ